MTDTPTDRPPTASPRPASPPETGQDPPEIRTQKVRRRDGTVKTVRVKILRRGRQASARS